MALVFNFKKNLFIYIILIILINTLFYIKKCKEIENNSTYLLNKKDYSDKKFAIIIRNCSSCGLFSVFMGSLGCIHKYIIEGYIPIIDIKSFPNVINGFNISKSNYWEKFFEQPFGYTLEEVLKNGKRIKTIICDDCVPRLYHTNLPFSEVQKIFWHDFAEKYLPIKKELIDLSNKIINKLFKYSNNILGVLTRGTDYLSLKPTLHPIPPNLSDLIRDVKEMDNRYSYDYIFFSTEDDQIREQFSKIYEKKIKQIKPIEKTNYNYTKKNFLGYNNNIRGNVEYNRIYLLNIIILSKCLDIITARCNGAAGIFILNKRFRNVKIYNLGVFNL